MSSTIIKVFNWFLSLWRLKVSEPSNLSSSPTFPTETFFVWHQLVATNSWGQITVGLIIGALCWSTCSFYDLPDSCRCGRNHGSLIQAQLSNVDDMEAVHILLWSDGVTDCSLVDVFWKFVQGKFSAKQGRIKKNKNKKMINKQLR